MFWTNPIVTSAFNSEIIEWDIQSGNVSMMEHYQLIPQKKIDKIKECPKSERLVKVGLLQQKDRAFAKALESAFNTTVEDFITANDLDRDWDIVSIKRDAVFVKNHQIPVPRLSPHIKFIPKNTYNGYLYLKPIEIYYKPGIDVFPLHISGISDELLPSEPVGIYELLIEVSNYVGLGDLRGLNEYMHSVADAYKKRELPFEWYREFNASSMFTYTMGDMTVKLAGITEMEIGGIDISYNYTNVILPVIQLLC